MTELDAAFEELAMEHEMHGLVPPDERQEGADGQTVIARDVDGDDRWYTDGTAVLELADDGEHAFELGPWARDVLTAAVVCEVARRGDDEEVLSVADLRRVLARMSPDGPVSLRELPF